MTQFAPTKPTIQELEQRFPLPSSSEPAFIRQRQRINELITGQRQGLLAIIGPCALTDDREIINKEGTTLYMTQSEHDTITTLHRLPPWKPRTRATDWHGLETKSDTTAIAFDIITQRAASAANVAIELGHIPHINRYGHRLSFAWIGGRNIQNSSLIKAVSTSLPSIPIGIKNGLDGNLDVAISKVRQAQRLRAPGDAEVVLIFRGGSNATTPHEWEKQYLKALELTQGALIVDTAHGSEMAHDLNENFQKSAEAQLRCIEHVLSIVKHHGVSPLGIMIEASSAKSPTDPVIPFEAALHEVMSLLTLTQQKAGY
jgi:phospho-2-dehydro-3-deoxyheptonate aldolase